jgi:hypothetical protein
LIIRETGEQSRRIDTGASAVCDSHHGLCFASDGNDEGGARVLQAHGAGLWKERNATIPLVLSDRDSPRSFACNQEFGGCQFTTSAVGSCGSAAADAGSGNSHGVLLSMVGIGYTLAPCFTSRQHFNPENLIFFLLSC